MKKGRKVFLKLRILAVGVLLSATAYPQRVLTLKEVINTALKNSLDIRIARNNYEAGIINNYVPLYQQ